MQARINLKWTKDTHLVSIKKRESSDEPRYDITWEKDGVEDGIYLHEDIILKALFNYFNYNVMDKG